MCTETKPHKHAELIIAWAKGAEIEYSHPDHPTPTWAATETPTWTPRCNYRIKPIPKPDVKRYSNIYSDSFGILFNSENEALSVHRSRRLGTCCVVFDGETGKPKSVSLI